MRRLHHYIKYTKLPIAFSRDEEFCIPAFLQAVPVVGSVGLDAGSIIGHCN
jgi:hypothetical protein